MTSSSLLTTTIFSSCLLLGGASLAQSADPFELIVIPDSQKFVRVMKTGGPNIFLTQTQWIKKHIKDENIVFVSHVGDVIENKKEQWPQASKIMDVIHGHVPYSVTFGNHDHGAPAAFNANRYKGMDWYLGASPDNRAHAQTFKGGGITFLHINLPYKPNGNHIKWAEGIIAEHSNLPTIISTHGYMADNSWGRSGIGNQIWKHLVEPNEQVFMTLNGHDWVSRHETGVTQSGRKVIQIQANWQEIVNGGNAMLQKIIFDPKQQQVRVRSYSPLFDLFHTDWTGQFAYSVSFTGEKITVNREIGPTHRVWNGSGKNNLWSTASNWGGQVPKAGEILRFKNAKQKITVNDLPAKTSFAGIVFEPGKFSAEYKISGHEIVLTGDIVNMGGYGPKTVQAGPTLSLPITLKGDRQINTGDWDMTIQGVIRGSGSLTKTHGRDYIRGSFDGRVYRGDLFLTNINTYTGNTSVTGGALILKNQESNNLIPNSPSIRLYKSAVLKVTDLKNETLALTDNQKIGGQGVLIGNLEVPSGAGITPGVDEIGTFNQKGALNMLAGSSLKIQIGGARLGSFDALSVEGGVSINGAKLELSKLGATYTPKVGDVFVIVQNDGEDAVKGQFVSSDGGLLPEGASVSLPFFGPSVTARISYKGGDGNDVALTVVQAKP